MTASGLLRQRVTVANEQQGPAYVIGGLLPALPVPGVATEILDFTGRHLRERIS